MTTGEILKEKLNRILSGEPWYGQSLYAIIDKVTFDIAFEEVPNAGYTIAGLVLHLIGWTEEVIDRLNEQPAGIPTSGDWPETGDPTEEKWLRWKDDLKLVNVNLSGLLLNLPTDKWHEQITDHRGGTPITNLELVEGAIQHVVYHSAQVALLAKLIKG